MNLPHRSSILLPWVAKKAGIGESEAMALWVQALAFAGGYTAINSPAYFKLAVDTWLEAVTHQCVQARAVAAPALPMIDWLQADFMDVDSWINPWRSHPWQSRRLPQSAVLPAPTWGTSPTGR
ncbi:MAG: hypothetical protein IPH08_15255 [Rhodocyclaceae bacterium]|jgi:hypothetical protein|nr:hypothetical protein [Rhodocyclaceae bacterium]MBK6908359.1 hypothetical protein [Rhodocyclaceae bacterium]